MVGFQKQTQLGHSRVPVATGVPTIDNTAPRVGNVMHGTPAPYNINIGSYQSLWVDHTNGDAVIVSNTASLTVGAGLLGSALEFWTRGISAGGASLQWAKSLPTSAVSSALVPANSGGANLPALTGDTSYLGVIGYVPGTWTNAATITAVLEWEDGTPIATFTGAGSYQEIPEDSGHSFHIVETATSVDGVMATVSGSNTIGPIAAPPPPFSVNGVKTIDFHQYSECGYRIWDWVVSPAATVTLTGDPSGCYESVQTSANSGYLRVKDIPGDNLGAGHIQNSTLTWHCDDNIGHTGNPTTNLVVPAYNPHDHFDLFWCDAADEAAGIGSTTTTMVDTRSGGLTLTFNSPVTMVTEQGNKCWDLSGNKIATLTGANALVLALAADRAPCSVGMVYRVPSTPANTPKAFCAWRNGAVLKAYVQQDALTTGLSWAKGDDAHGAANSGNAQGAGLPPVLPAVGSMAVALHRQNGGVSDHCINRYYGSPANGIVAPNTGVTTCTTFEAFARNGSNAFADRAACFGVASRPPDVDAFCRWAADHKSGITIPAMGALVDVYGTNGGSAMELQFLEDFNPGWDTLARGAGTFTVNGSGIASLASRPGGFVPRYHGTTPHSDTGVAGAIAGELEWMLDHTGAGMSAYKRFSQSESDMVIEAEVTPVALLDPNATPPVNKTSGFGYVSGAMTGIGAYHIASYGYFEGVRCQLPRPVPGQFAALPWTMPLSTLWRDEYDLLEGFSADTMQMAGTNHVQDGDSAGAVNHGVLMSRLRAPCDFYYNRGSPGFYQAPNERWHCHNRRKIIKFVYGAGYPDVPGPINGAPKYPLINYAVGYTGAPIQSYFPMSAKVDAIRSWAMYTLGAGGLMAGPLAAPPTITAPSTIDVDAQNWATLVSLSSMTKLTAISEWIKQLKAYKRPDKDFKPGDPVLWGSANPGVDISATLYLSAWDQLTDVFLAKGLESAGQALVSLKGHRTLTPHGGISWDATHGWTSDGVAGSYIRTGVFLSADPLWQGWDSHWSAWIDALPGSGAIAALLGADRLVSGASSLPSWLGTGPATWDCRHAFTAGPSGNGVTWARASTKAGRRTSSRMNKSECYAFEDGYCDWGGIFSGGGGAAINLPTEELLLFAYSTTVAGAACKVRKFELGGAVQWDCEHFKKVNDDTLFAALG